MTAHGLLKHAVTVLLAHIGFDKASDTAIATLTDSADFFLKRISLLLKVASEEKNYGFPVRKLKNFKLLLEKMIKKNFFLPGCNGKSFG